MLEECFFQSWLVYLREPINILKKMNTIWLFNIAMENGP